jgi:hypothetical protein
MPGLRIYDYSKLVMLPLAILAGLAHDIIRIGTQEAK